MGVVYIYMLGVFWLEHWVYDGGVVNWYVWILIDS